MSIKNVKHSQVQAWLAGLALAPASARIELLDRMIKPEVGA